jgi:hypothetical protein
MIVIMAEPSNRNLFMGCSYAWSATLRVYRFGHAPEVSNEVAKGYPDKPQTQLMVGKADARRAAARARFGGRDLDSCPVKVLTLVGRSCTMMGLAEFFRGRPARPWARVCTRAGAAVLAGPGQR